VPTTAGERIKALFDGTKNLPDSTMLDLKIHKAAAFLGEQAYQRHRQPGPSPRASRCAQTTCSTGPPPCPARLTSRLVPQWGQRQTSRFSLRNVASLQGPGHIWARSLGSRHDRRLESCEGGPVRCTVIRSCGLGIRHCGLFGGFHARLILASVVEPCCVEYRAGTAAEIRPARRHPRAAGQPRRARRGAPRNADGSQYRLVRQ
jgi:hypothetical protein